MPHLSQQRVAITLCWYFSYHISKKFYDCEYSPHTVEAREQLGELVIFFYYMGPGGLNSCCQFGPQAPLPTEPSGQTTMHWLDGTCSADQVDPKLLVITYLHLLTAEIAWCGPRWPAMLGILFLNLWNNVPSSFSDSYLLCCCLCPSLPLSKMPVKCKLYLRTLLCLLAVFIF